MSERKPLKMSSEAFGPVAEDPVARRLEKFLRARGCAPQKSGVWPVNWADTIAFAKKESARGKKTALKDPSVNVLLEVRRLKHTCPGCDERVETDGPLALVKRGDFLWHETCLDPRSNMHDMRSNAPIKDLKDCVEEAETDLKALISGVLAAQMDTTTGYKLKVTASELRDKYSDSKYFREG